MTRVSERLATFTARLQDGFDAVRQRDPFASIYRDNLAPARDWHPERMKLDEYYDLQVTPPPDRLAQLLAKAATSGTDVILIEPPRPGSGMRHVRGGVDAFADRLQAEAQKLGRPLWLVGLSWPDDLFRDAIHLGREGRARYIADLRQVAETAR